MQVSYSVIITGKKFTIWCLSAMFAVQVDVLKKFVISGVLVKCMMHGSLMKMQFGNQLAFWTNQLLSSPMLEK